MSSEITVIIADDHSMFRQGVRALLETEGFKVVGEATNGQEAIRLGRTQEPQVAILDYSMPVLNGIDAATAMQKQSPNTKLILLTMYEEEAYALAALRCGVRGIVLKSQAATDLINAIRDVVRGSIYLSPSISDSVLSALLSRHDPESELLTVREKQVVQLIAEGNTSKEVARLLHVSVKTAESHRSRIMAKLDIHNTADLVRYAIRQGIIQA
jgi:DNA-binding NarL/FixJ family response regulator